MLSVSGWKATDNGVQINQFRIFVGLGLRPDATTGREFQSRMIQERGGFRITLMFLLAYVFAAGMSASDATYASDYSWGVAPLQQAAFAHQAIADFDGDQLPDRAELISRGYDRNIRLTLSSPWVISLHFSSEAPEFGVLHAEDIDHDSDKDLIWVCGPKLSNAALWLNNGVGVFTRISDPSSYAAAVERLSADESRTDLSKSSSSAGLKVIGASRYSASPDSPACFVQTPRRLASFAGQIGAPDPSPCVARYPKRGPPSLPIFI